MRKFIFSTILCLSFAVSTVFAQTYSGGSGTEQDPYQISSKADMEALAYAVSGVTSVNGPNNYSGKYFLLTQNLSGITTIINGSNESNCFSGIFDGGGHTINTSRGVFGYVSGATIKNLGVSGSMEGVARVGGICGYAASGTTISDCYNMGNISATATTSYAGGICGYAASGTTISNCYNTGNISFSSSSYAGGICGYAVSGTVTISNCSNTGDIFSSYYNSYYSYAGGICGYVASGTIIVINNCHNKGNISFSSSSNSSSPYYSGGICGYTASSTGTISNCYNTGDISSRSYSGGICGEAISSAGTITITITISNCYNTGDISSMSSSSGGICGLAYSDTGTNTSTITISNCYNKGDISSPEYSGGICGYAASYAGPITISNCYNTGNISSYSSSGGICGNTASSADIITISNCYNTGNISSYSSSPSSPYSSSGGICGYAASGTTISNCYNTGNISFYSYSYSSRSYSGGICGRGEAKISNCIAANATIEGPAVIEAYFTGRIEASGYASIQNCYALASMQVRGKTINSQDANSKDGKDIDISDFQSQSWIEENLGWDFDKIWNMPDTPDGFPGLDITTHVIRFNLSSRTVQYGSTVTFSASSDNTITPIQYAVSNSDIAEVGNGTIIIKKAGTVTVSAWQAGADSYPFDSVSVDLTINKAPLTVRANAVTAAYGDTPQFTCRYEGFVNNETEAVLTQLPVYSCDGINAGDHVVTPSGAKADSYVFTYENGLLTIIKRDLHVIPEDTVREYGLNNPGFVLLYTGFAGDETASVIYSRPVASTVASQYSHAGEYDITCSGGEARNYNFIYETGKLTVTKAPLLAIADNVYRLYGYDNPDFTVSCIGFRFDDTQAVLTEQPQASTVADKTSDAGQYPITVSGGDALDYDFNYRSGRLTITKAPLTVTAENKTREQGEANPDFTLAYTGFRNDDDESVLDQSPVITCPANADSPTGFYDIELQGGYDNNYEFTLFNGRLEVISPTGNLNPGSPELTVYPTPAKNRLYIRSDVPVERIELYNQTGVCVLTDRDVRESLDISFLPGGFYLARIYVNGIPQTKKVIIKN